MRLNRIIFSSVLAILAFASHPNSAVSQQMDEQKLLTPSEIKWGPAPPSIPPGAQAIVLYGDLGKDGVFAFRLKVRKGYHIPPHTHPKPEIVTVISGTVRLGMGETADRKKAKVLPVGSFFALSPGHAHYFFADTDTVIQLNSSGPWGISYINPKDDPREKAKQTKN